MTGKQQGVVEYEPCYVAFADILGFKALVLRSQECQQTRCALVRALDVVATLSPGGIENRDGLCRTQIRFFSDGVALFIPTVVMVKAVWMVTMVQHRIMNQTASANGKSNHNTKNHH